MIPAQQLMAKMGKKKFVEFATRSCGRGETGAQKAHRRRFGTNIKHKMCEHKVWIIENYKYKGCAKCIGKQSTKPRDFVPYFNVGLGAYVESRSDERRAARIMGLREAG